MLIAIHALQNPAWKRGFLKNQRNVLAQRGGAYREGLSAEQYNELLERVTTDEFYAATMLGLIPKVAGVIGSMHRTLVNFDDRLLATSDHPVTVVPLWIEEGPKPVSAVLASAPTECLELRFALNPSQALVLSWRDLPDSIDGVRGDDVVAAQLNRAVIA